MSRNVVMVHILFIEMQAKQFRLNTFLFSMSQTLALCTSADAQTNMSCMEITIDVQETRLSLH
eukprot:m.224782 g.224782  ORF g.224782 m.224782 type:complete len:63 (+) comp15150_c1_seq4:1454-1642(+)